MLQAIAESLQAVVSGWELDGLICGLSCTPSGDDSHKPGLLADLLNTERFAEAFAQQVGHLLALSRAQLQSTDCDFYPLLPDEDDGLAVRAEALGLWSQGFLAGYGAVASQPGEEIRETLQDLAALAQIDPDLDESEDAAWDLERVTEYLRVAVMDLYLAAQQATEPPATPDGALLH